jgi:hypothetical protein
MTARALADETDVAVVIAKFKEKDPGGIGIGGARGRDMSTSAAG